MSNDSFWGEPIHQYTRKEAIEDGMLIEVDQQLATEAGFKLPICISAALWHQWVEPDQEAQNQGQSITGRIWDVLVLCRHAAFQNPTTHKTVFKVAFRQNDRLTEVKLIAVVGGDDDGDPCLTIMLPEDD